MKNIDLFIPGILTVQLAAILLMVTGCCTAVAVKSTGQPSIGREEAGSIAQQEAWRRGWRDMEVDAVQFKEGHWLVFIESLPIVLGGHALVEISSDGHIIQFHPGK